MARPGRIKRTNEGVAHYHLMSRTNNRSFLFAKGRVKTELVDALRRAAEFSGVRLLAYVAMDNHFHVVCRVTRTAEPVAEAELLRRVGVLKGAAAAQELAERWDSLRYGGFLATLEAEMDRLRVRMNDISEFVKTFKETFDVLFKRETPYCGSIWSGRFASTLIEGGKYLATCMKYVRLNPVRARIVSQAKDYLWSWCESLAENEVLAGPGTAEEEKRLLRRVAQVGAGRIFGSAEFVRAEALFFGSKWKAKSCAGHPVDGLGWSTHGWRGRNW